MTFAASDEKKSSSVVSFVSHPEGSAKVPVKFPEFSEIVGATTFTGCATEAEGADVASAIGDGPASVADADKESKKLSEVLPAKKLVGSLIISQDQKINTPPRQCDCMEFKTSQDYFLGLPESATRPKPQTNLSAARFNATSALRGANRTSVAFQSSTEPQHV